MRFIISLACGVLTAAVVTGLAMMANAGPAVDLEPGLSDRSDMVVVGQLTGQKMMMVGPDGRRETLAALRIDDVIKGEGRRAIVPIALATTAVPAVGEAGVWYLRRHTGGVSGVFALDEADRFRSLTTTRQAFNAPQ